MDGVVTLLSGGQPLPSGHAANVAFGAVPVIHLLGLLRGRAFSRVVTARAAGAASAVMAATSLPLRVHGASDLLAGTLAGTLAGLLVGCTRTEGEQRGAGPGRPGRSSGLLQRQQARCPAEGGCAGPAGPAE